jgi:3',5'-cyclic AMP phosphodiesterase CpdA
VEGLCGNYSLAKLQFEDFFRFEEKYIPIPFLVAKGNHDITGPGADSAYTRTVFPFINKNTGSIVNDSKYVFRKNNAVFFFYDDYQKTSLRWLEEEIKKYKDVKYKFVVMHEPVIPFDARSKWGVFMKTTESESREKLLNILGDNKVIVLVGHLHEYGIVVRKTKNGKFVQIALSSVLNSVNQKPEQIRTGLNNYNETLVDLEPEFSPETRKERMDMLKNEKPFIEYFEYANTAGYNVFHVTDDKVMVDIYTGTGLKKWKSLVISDFFK